MEEQRRKPRKQVRVEAGHEGGLECGARLKHRTKPNTLACTHFKNICIAPNATRCPCSRSKHGFSASKMPRGNQRPDFSSKTACTTSHALHENPLNDRLLVAVI